jgi:hypothetical protein
MAPEVPRHDAERGEDASEGEKENTASRWPPVLGGDEDELVLEIFLTKGYWAGLGPCWARACWAAGGAPLLGSATGKPLSIFFSGFFFLFYFLFSFSIL